MRDFKSITEFKKVGFISTRIAGTDGVSLEIEKWAEVFEQEGFKCFYFAGELDRPPEQSYLVPEAVPPRWKGAPRARVEAFTSTP